MNPRIVHLAVGLIMLVVFALTGYYMRVHHYYEAADRIRFSIRANHVYILFLGLLNLGLASGFQRHAAVGLARLQTVASILILIATATAVYAFFFEDKTTADRPFLLATVVMASFGTLMHVLAAFSKPVK